MKSFFYKSWELVISLFLEPASKLSLSAPAEIILFKGFIDTCLQAACNAFSIQKRKCYSIDKVDKERALPIELKGGWKLFSLWQGITSREEEEKAKLSFSCTF